MKQETGRENEARRGRKWAEEANAGPEGRAARVPKGSEGRRRTGQPTGWTTAGIEARIAQPDGRGERGASGVGGTDGAGRADGEGLPWLASGVAGVSAGGVDAAAFGAGGVCAAGAAAFFSASL
ncbi:MAG: hypothetical protein ABFD16_23780, partial [Thermoguttaceae bacterium]